MQKTKDILHWYFNPSVFKYTAEHLFSNNTKEIVKKSLTKLDKIAKNSEGNKPPDTRLVKDIYNLFQDNYTLEYLDLNSLFSKRNVRVLVWTLDYQPLESTQVILFTEQFNTAKNIITDKWRDSFIISLWHVLLKNWTILQNHKEQRTSLTKLLNAKCSEYNRSRKDILNISTNISLFLKHDSPKEYANRLLKSKILII
jgi:hypothetical protein